MKKQAKTLFVKSGDLKMRLLRLANLQPFLVIIILFCQLHKYISQNLSADSHFEGLNIIKSYDINYIFKNKLFFNFGRKNPENLSFKIKNLGYTFVSFSSPQSLYCFLFSKLPCFLFLNKESYIKLIHNWCNGTPLQ